MKNIRIIIFSIISIFLLCIIAGCTSRRCKNHDDDDNGYCDNCNYQMSIKVNCPHCNAINDNTSKYCYSCGKEIILTKQCSSCNTKLDINTTYCTNCGTNVCNHNWIDATCTTPKICLICNITEDIMLDHNYESLVIKPTCTEQGFTIYSCKECKHTYIDDYMNKLGIIHKL